MRTARSRTFRRSTPRRQRIWAREHHNTGNLTGGFAHDLLTDFKSRTSGGQLLSTMEATVLRIRLQLVVEHTASVSVAPLNDAAYGVIVSDENTAAEVLNDGPMTRRQADWAMFLPLMWNNTATGAEARIECQCSDELDVKSSRKLQGVEDKLWLVFEPADLGDGYRHSITASTLLLLH